MTAPGHGYSGLVAEVYDLHSAPYDDFEYYRTRIAAHGGPALEIASGTGRLLVPLRQAGLDVEGVEPSEDMNAHARKKAEAAGVEVAIHRQYMQELDLPGRYATVFIPVASFTLLEHLRDAEEALRRFHHHLSPGGCLLLSLDVPYDSFAANNEWHLTRRMPRPDGSLVLISAAGRANKAKQVFKSTTKYEVFDASGTLVHTEHHPFTTRWYYPHEFTLMLEAAGFTDVVMTGDLGDEPFADHHRILMVRALRAG